MKKTFYIFQLFALLFFSCAEEFETGREQRQQDAVVNFALRVPEYLPATRASYENEIRDVSLLLFDSKGLFLSRAEASNLVCGEGSGSFSARIPAATGIIHFVANYAGWDNFDPRAAQGKDEREVIPALETGGLVFWGRNLISDFDTPPQAILYRNQAKVTVISTADNFAVNGFAVCNYAETGTVAPFNPDRSPTPFTVVEDVPTIPPGTTPRGSQDTADCDLSPKYICESENPYSDQVCVIVRGTIGGGSPMYYKLQLLDADKNPYTLVRNYHYKVVIRQFNGNAYGSATFDGAVQSEPSNNIYAEIIKESTSVSDDQGNVLTVDRLNFLFTAAGQLRAVATYTKNGVAANGEIYIALDGSQGSEILTGLANAGGVITAAVSAVGSGQKQARILVRAGVLSRVITVTSSMLYEFTPARLSPYGGRDSEVTLSFNIPARVPEFMFPLACMVRTEKLYPVAPNKDMKVEFDGGAYKYTFMAHAAGRQDVFFRTGFDDPREVITIENPYFHTGVVSWDMRVDPVNGDNLVDYGQGSAAVLRFFVPEGGSFPKTVRIKTAKFRTAQSGTSAVSDGYNYVITRPGGYQIEFTSRVADSEERMAVSVPGYATANLDIVNVLPADVTNVGGTIKRDGNNINSREISSSAPWIVPDFTTTGNSRYDNMVIKKGARLSDEVTFSYRRLLTTYRATLSVRQLLSSPSITLTN